jgi:hypothetical protein
MMDAFLIAWRQNPCLGAVTHGKMKQIGADLMDVVSYRVASKNPCAGPRLDHKERP